MKITRIERQKKRPDRYSIYVDDEFLLGVNEEIIIKFMLFKGQDLTEEELEEIQSAENNHKVFLKGLNYLSYGMRSVSDMRKYLLKHKEDYQVKGSVDKVIDWAIERLLSLGYLNDQNYAEAYVRSAASINSKGPSVIHRDLIGKGVHPDTIMSAMDEYSSLEQIENIEKLAAKFTRTKTKYPPKMLKQKLYTYLLQKGYEGDMINDHLRTIEFEGLVDHQDELVDKEAQKLVRRHQRKSKGYVLKQKITASLFGKGFDYELINQWLDDNNELFEDK